MWPKCCTFFPHLVLTKDLTHSSWCFLLLSLNSLQQCSRQSLPISQSHHMRREKTILLSQCNLCVTDSQCEIHIFELLMEDSECVVSEATPCAVVKKQTKKKKKTKKHSLFCWCDSVLCLVAQSRLTLWDPMDCRSPGSSVHGDPPGKNTGVGSLSLLQRIFPTQESIQGLLHCGRILYQLSYQGSL